MAENKKILVLFTGGTIGSVLSDGVITVAADGRFELIAAYYRAFGREVSFECRQIMNILSENMNTPCWERLIQVLSLVDTSNYRGIIITHGSDTLAYTSALLGMYFRHLDIPAYIVAANKPIAEAGSNALFNFASAVDRIRAGDYVGVYTVYERVMPSTRIIPADTYSDAFSVYGEFDGNPFHGIHESWLRTPKPRLFTREVSFKKPVLMIPGYPGIDFSRYDVTGCAAVLFDPYHSGTGPADESIGEKYSLCRFVERCLRQGVKVYICGIKDLTRMYDTLRDIINAGAIPLEKISAPAAYMKLLLAHNQQEHPVKRIMDTCLFYEKVGEKAK